MYAKSDKFFMDIAIKRAWKFQGLTFPNPSVGALITLDKKIISLRAHRECGGAHAEVLALKDAFFYLTKSSTLSKELKGIEDPKSIHSFLLKHHNNIFSKCEIFVTLEPCNHYGKTPPCAELLKALNPRRIIIATRDNNFRAKGGISTLNGIQITYGVEEKRANNLIYPFLQYQKHNNLNIFKIAHRLSGDYKHGFISNSSSRILTHNLRSVCDNILVSGQTLRYDNPLLDIRNNSIHSTKLPKIIIATKHIRDVANYKIKDRKVNITNLENLNLNGYTLIEGGINFLNIIKQYVRIDLVLGYIAPDFSYANLSNVQIKGEFLHIDTIEDSEGQVDNILYWMKLN